MGLLKSAIQEYLKEHHPEWIVKSSLSTNIIIGHQDKQQPHRIRIDTEHNLISSRTGTSYKYMNWIFDKYTENTILPQITSIINQTKQS